MARWACSGGWRRKAASSNFRDRSDPAQGSWGVQTRKDENCDAKASERSSDAVSARNSPAPYGLWRHGAIGHPNGLLQRSGGMVTKKRVGVGLLVLGVVALDLATKRWALQRLSDSSSLEVLGGLVPITLTFNRGAAFGLTIGNDPRWFFIPVTLIAIAFLLLLIWQSGPTEGGRAGAAALVLGGAVGNLYDRVRWDRGVVDFIGPIDLGFMDWPIFNVADTSITCGAILLAVSFFREDARNRRGSQSEAAEEEELDSAMGP